MENKQVLVIGAGVVGLSTAIRALEAGFDVTLIAEIFPADPKSINYTSCWAGANHISIATHSPFMHKLERETMDVFLDLMKEDPDVPVMTRPQIEHIENFGTFEETQNTHISKFYSDYRSLSASELPKGIVAGSTFTTILVDVPDYLPYLINRFLNGGGRAFRTKLKSISSLFTAQDRPAFQRFPLASADSAPPLNPAAVINCTGLGALSLGDVLDTDVYPTRGETLLIRAPWVHHGMSYLLKDSDITYIIPRKSGDVILGGTFQVNDWHPTSRPETVKSIKERGIHAYPELLPLDKRELRDINDLDVIEECVGLRTTRKGGIRLETTKLDIGGRSIPIVHNYGHGGAGYQSSWGSAKSAIELLQEALRN
ncbi:hypothetical protein C8R43DRAFT_1019067 [Mycena crocata]|nr:hypothetical protein C8R43DRAFT_1019067 [Mycena crocata]